MLGIFSSLLFWQSAIAQLDTIHYFPPLHESYPTANQGALYISTPSIAPVVFTITDGAGTLITAGAVSNALPYRYQMNGVNAKVLLPTSDLNSVLTDKGFIVSATAPVYANLRYVMVNNNQSISITSKGRRSFGQSFRIAHAKADQASPSHSQFAVMATEDNTQVTINLVGSSLILSGTAPPLTTAPIVVNLNKGNSYILSISNAVNGANRDNMIGKLITSNRPIVTVMGNYLGCFAAGNHDVGFDQPVAQSLLGREYAFLQGVGGTDKEKVLVIATQNATDIFLNGGAIPFATLNAGDHAYIDGINYTTDSVMFIRATNPVYGWQVLFGSNAFANWGLNFVPPVSCLSEKFVDNIPAIDSIGTRKFTGNLNIITYVGSTITINGGPPGVLPVAIPGSNLEAYRIHGLTGTFNVYSNTIAVVGFYGRNGPSSYSGYFSGWDSIPEIFAGDTVCPDTLFVNDDFDSYQWLANGTLVPFATDTFLDLASSNGAFNIIVTKGTCVDTSGTFVVSCVLPVLLEGFWVECTADGRPDFQWATLEEISSRRFVVEGTRDGRRWEEIGRREAVGNSSGRRIYAMTLARGAKRHQWYRLRIEDQNGRTAYSQIALSDCAEQDTEVQVWPQPSQGVVWVELYGFKTAVELEVYAPDGRQILRKSTKMRGQWAQTVLELPRGNYLLRVRDAQRQVVKRVIVE